MSVFGDQTFKQELLDFILDNCRERNRDLLELTGEASEVLGYIAIYRYRDPELRKMVGEPITQQITKNLARQLITVLKEEAKLE